MQSKNLMIFFVVNPRFTINKNRRNYFKNMITKETRLYHSHCYGRKNGTKAENDNLVHYAIKMPVNNGIQ